MKSKSIIGNSCVIFGLTFIMSFIRLLVLRKQWNGTRLPWRGGKLLSLLIVGQAKEERFARKHETKRGSEGVWDLARAENLLVPRWGGTCRYL